MAARLQLMSEYLDHYLEMHAEVVGAESMGRKGVQVFLTDSIEAGFQNWTDEMIAEFKRLRGYPMSTTQRKPIVEQRSRPGQLSMNFAPKAAVFGPVSAYHRDPLRV